VAVSARCRGCGATAVAGRGWRCPDCGERRNVVHLELDRLSIAHIDCDAFYATIEKRDDPSLRRRPVIVGGSHRGVVAACCYVARLSGVRSAMPMFRALKLCPDAVVIPPNMAKYREVGEQVRELMLTTTPLVEPLSIDEAFLDLSGTDAAHGGPPAQTLIRLQRRIEEEIGITVSIGLAPNKFLAKIASDLDKPRGFAVIGKAEAKEFLAPRPVGLIFGVGEAMRRQLAARGVMTIGQLQQMTERTLSAEFGAMGRRLYRFARGEDERKVDPNAPTKSISAETTFDEDLSAKEGLLAELWPLAQTVARRLKGAELGAQTVTVKLKTADFRLLTRHRRLSDPTQLAETLYQAAKPLVEREADGRAFRLIGIGAETLVEGVLADPPDLLDGGVARRAGIERAIDQVEEELGPGLLARGRGFKPKEPS
jgi:DNA polymerase-4